jgi:hypothetical protein
VIACDKCNKCNKCDKCEVTCDATNPILITHAISHRLSCSYHLLGVRRISDLNDAARAALVPLLGDDDAAVDCDGNVDDVTRPVWVTAINTMDGNAASRDAKMVGWGTIVVRRGRQMLSIAVKGGVSLARRQRRRWEDLATTTSK